MKQIEKRVQKLEINQQSDPEVDFSILTDEELHECEQVLVKTGENKDYSLLSDQELNRLIELINKAENETDIKKAE